MIELCQRGNGTGDNAGIILYIRHAPRMRSRCKYMRWVLKMVRQSWKVEVALAVCKCLGHDGVDERSSHFQPSKCILDVGGVGRRVGV